MLSEQELKAASRRLIELRGVVESSENLVLAKAEIERTQQVLNAIRYAREGVVICTMCFRLADAKKAHIHQGQWIGDECCWDERLKTTE